MVAEFVIGRPELLVVFFPDGLHFIVERPASLQLAGSACRVGKIVELKFQHSRRPGAILGGLQGLERAIDTIG